MGRWNWYYFNMKGYVESPGKAVETDSRFSHVMAITLDPTAQYKRGVIRCITSREGNVEIRGYKDRSVLHLVSEDAPNHFIINERLHIENEAEVIKELNENNLDFLGLEDPDIWIDGQTGLTHLYFTMPFIGRDKTDQHSLVHLGHAVGKDLLSLRMTEPVLLGTQSSYENARAKEVSIAPLNSHDVRLNLFEGHNKISGDPNVYSTVRVAAVRDMGSAWEFGPTVFHPKEHGIAWIGGHASPGPLFDKSFIDIGEGKLVGIINGREVNQHIGTEIKYGMFSAGLFIYDYEHGVVEWVSSKPFIQDSEAKTITFASQFIETGAGKGTLFAHVDDSFVREYTLDSSAIQTLLP